MRLNFLTPPPIPNRLPNGLQTEIKNLRKLPGKEDVLHRAYDVLNQKYRGYRLRTLTHLPALFMVDVDKLWQKSGFLHCTNSNYLLKIMLVRSGRFSDDDIRFRWTVIYFWSPHQYVQVRLDDGKWVDVDLWGKVYGIPFGRHAHGWHSGTRTVSNT